MTLLPVRMCVVHGMHGSKLWIARRMSIPLQSSGRLYFSRIGVWGTASGFPIGSLGDASTRMGVPSEAALCVSLTLLGLELVDRGERAQADLAPRGPGLLRLQLA